MFGLGEGGEDESDAVVEPLVGHLLADVVDAVVEVPDLRSVQGDEFAVVPFQPVVDDVGDPELLPRPEIGKGALEGSGRSPPVARRGVMKSRLAMMTPCLFRQLVAGK